MKLLIEPLLSLKPTNDRKVTTKGVTVLTNQTDKLCFVDPVTFLAEVFEIDQLAAVRIASQWSKREAATPEQYSAAWEIARRQQVVSNCHLCHWPELPDDPHACSSVRGNPDDHGYEPDPWGEYM